ncbi:urease accessory protein UreF [Actinospica sp. MGRD01-02]|uniref:Urease accessory protein UreF n=1 Tax=Actinospica acidithermotolerans TaxID=2828514 RepID=A0A941EIG3_9ACTN|nr:urease accessory UreF family protein [Actinospica acidithermotolerans]MBR7831127.1 urease accessory protein UreF [Actinospica acidithermotolerans]
MSLIALLMLADSRLPAGTHAHSGGLEAAVTAERVRHADELYEFLLGRLTTIGLVGAAFSAAALTAGPAGLADFAELDAEFDARSPSPAQRRASRALGRQLLRAVGAGWSGPALTAAAAVHPNGPHQPIAFGAACVAAGVCAQDVAMAAALSSVTGPASAATRLIGIDPDAVTAVLAALEPSIRDTADAAMKAALGPISELPSFSAPRLDISAEHHSTWEVRLFAS